MSSKNNNKENPVLKIKKKRSIPFKIIDSAKILIEKKEALKTIDLDDYDININLANDNAPKQIKKKISKEKETSIIKSSNIIFVSDISFQNENLILEKNLHQLEKQMKKLKIKGNKKNKKH